MNDTVSIKSALESVGVVSMTPKGMSMYPFVKNTDSIVVVKPPRPIEKYDIVLFALKDNYALHRVIKTDGDTVTTAGDNNYFNDRPIKTAEIVGVLHGFYRGKKYVDVLGKKKGFYIAFSCFPPVKYVRIFFIRGCFFVKSVFNKLFKKR